MLPVILENVAIVVLSASNNPRLLNGDFLKQHGIVSNEWIVTDTLVTPPFAQVTFENELQIMVEENRIHFRANGLKGFSWEDELPRIAIDYMKLLPHVHYGDVGINFTYISNEPHGEAAEEAVISKFLKPGPWLECDAGITGTVLELQYRKEFPYMNVKIGVLETFKPEGKKLEGLIFNVNFHHAFQSNQYEERTSYLKSISLRKEQFFHFLETLPF